LPVEALHPELYGGPLETDYEMGRISTAQFLREARARGRLRCHDGEVAEAWADIFWPNPEVADLLPVLKSRVRMVLGSNTNELHSRHFRRQFADTLQHFHALVLSHEIGARKPDVAFFRHCQLQAGCPAERCLFIDDLPTNVAGAEACGLRGHVYTGTDDLRRRLVSFGLLPTV
jgi:putative hydrolase of the HAD superfamily